MRIAIVNDDLVSTRILDHIVTIDDEHEVAWIAYDGNQAVSKCLDDTPDIILMDLKMPEMNGVEATRQIMKQSPCSILIVTASVKGNASMVFEAMGAGAMDVISTPTLTKDDTSGAIKAIHKKIKTIGRLNSSTKILHAVENKKPAASKDIDAPLPLIAIGSSTGGPSALVDILSALPANLNAGIIIVQHVDAEFSASMATWLDEQTPLEVRIAVSGDKPEPGKVLVAGTADHLIFNKRGTLIYTEEPIDYAYRPSADVFFKSAAKYWPGTIIGVLLTGMGRDGAEGLLAIRNKNMYTIAQNKETCAVYGMPKEAVKLNAAVDVLPLNKISDKLMEKLEVIPEKLKQEMQ
jgi:two-component system response regulator WspF